ncbi:glutaredoxin family protein [Winogradskyella sp.]|uniref:glutaredoxin family protein n=1 Tax=Winogradskyella sp. TaxID=1883156 RepID=UPI003F6CA8D2
MRIFIFLLAFSITQTAVSCGKASKKEATQKDLKEIIIYGSGTCHYCIDTKTYLTEKNIPFVFHDLDLDPKKIEEMYTKLRKANISTANFQIPVVDKGGKIITNDYGTFEIFLSKIDE